MVNKVQILDQFSDNTFIYCIPALHEKFEDIKGVIRSRKIKERQTIQWSKETGQTMICKTLHIILKIEQCEPNKETEVNPTYSAVF